jgi:hypothetical protein
MLIHPVALGLQAQHAVGVQHQLRARVRRAVLGRLALRDAQDGRGQQLERGNTSGRLMAGNYDFNVHRSLKDFASVR